MIIIDVNLLMYAYQVDSPQHHAAEAWLKRIFAGPDVIGLAWITVWAFIRLSTNSRVWPNPMGSTHSI